MVLDFATPAASRGGSASLFLSMLSLLLSVCALIIAMDTGGGMSRSRPMGEQLVTPATEALSNRVTLEGLTIAPGQLLPGAVASADLADGAVVERAISDGAVTPSKLHADAIRAIARTVTSSTSVIGEVDETGAVVRGTRYTAERTGNGEYVLTFDEPFLAPPVVVAVAQSYGVCYLPAQTIGPSSVRIKCMSDLLGSAPHAANTRFSFYAAPAL